MLFPRLFLISIIFSICLLSVVHADDKFSETQNTKQFPQNVVIEYNNEPIELSLTGLTIRRKYFLNIYSMAHYAQQQSAADSNISDDSIYKNILQNNGTKQISMVFLRKLSAKQIQKSLRSGIKLNSNKDEYLEFLPKVEEFMQAIYSDVKKNDEFTIRWYPDGSVVSLFQGEQISLIKDNKFAKTLWAIWFGKFSIVNRKALIKELLTSS